MPSLSLPRPSRPRRWAQLLLVILLGVGGLARGAGPLAAQTGVRFPYAPVDVATYHTFDECLAAVDRLLGSLGLRNSRVDAYIAPPGRSWAPMPDTVRWTADRCTSAPAAPRSDSLGPTTTYEFLSTVRLFLLARRDTTVARLVEQQLASVRGDTVAERQIEDQLLGAYRQARRRAEAEALLEVRLKRTTAVEAVVEAHGALEDFADQIGDTARALQHAAALVADAERLKGVPSRVTEVFDALKRLHRRELLDSLARSTASYNALIRSFQVRTLGPAILKWAGPLTTPALPVVADYWFPRSGKGSANLGPRPVPGRTNLVISINGFIPMQVRPGQPNIVARQSTSWLLGHNSVCYISCPAFEGWRQLAKRFPQLEITLVARTAGRVGTMAHPDPAEEAALFRSWLHDSQQLPWVLGVSKGPFTRLPAPDRRVLFEADTANGRSAYLGGSYPHPVVLIDHAGNLVANETGEWPAWQLQQFGELIEATLKQPVGAVP